MRAQLVRITAGAVILGGETKSLLGEMVLHSTRVGTAS